MKEIVRENCYFVMDMSENFESTQMWQIWTVFPSEQKVIQIQNYLNQNALYEILSNLQLDLSVSLNLSISLSS